MFRKIRYTLLFICVISPMTAIFAQCQLNGNVTEKITHLPIASATVYIPQLARVIQTETNGTFKLSNLPKGNINIHVSIVGYQSTIIFATLNDSINSIEISLENEDYETDEVIIYGNSKIAASETSLNIATITSDEINKKGSISIADAMATIPGMSQLSTGAGISKPIIRGLGGNRIQTMLMGMRFDNQQWQDEHGLGLFDMGIDKIEIIKGPASLLYGSEAIGGVMEIIEERPIITNTSISDFNIKTFSNTLGASVNYGYRKASENKYKRFRIGFDSHADYRTGKNERILNSRFEGYHLKLTWGKKKGNRVTEWNNMISINQFGFIMDSLNKLNRKPLDNPWRRKMDGPKHMVGFLLLTNQNTWYLHQSKYVLNWGYNTNLRLENEGGSQISLAMLLNTININQQVSFNKNPAVEFTIGNQLLFQNNKNFGGRTIIPDANIGEASLYVYRKQKIRNTIIESGLRYDSRWISTSATGKINTWYPENPALEVSTFSRRLDAFNGSIGIVYRLNEHLFSKANISSGFRSGNLAELSSNGLHEGSMRWEIGDISLKKEQNFNAEIGLNYSTRWTEIKLAIYNNRFIHYIYLSPTGTEFIGFNIYRFLQKNATIRGGEVSIDLLPKLLKVIALNVSYSHIKGFTDDNENLPFIPSNRLQTELKKSVGKDKQSLIYSGITYSFAQNSPGQFETNTPGYSLVHLGICHTFKNKIQTTLVCNNLLNKNFTDHLSRFKYYGIANMGRNIVFSLHLPI